MTEYLQIKILTTHDGIEPVCDRLTGIGLEGFIIEDFEDFESFLKENTQYWDYVDDDLMAQKKGSYSVSVFIPENEQANDSVLIIRQELESLRQILPAVNPGTLEVIVTPQNKQDWENEWKKYYKPFTVGKRLFVVPAWESADNPGGRIIFKNNPGSAFGSGSHQSTRLCMEALEQHVKSGDTVLDLGCGSGILSIISALLGANDVYGIDIDPNAIMVSRRNAELNNVGEITRFDAGNVLSDPDNALGLKANAYSIVAANIVADVIMALAPGIKGLLCDDGVFIAGGIIDIRLDEVSAVLRQSGLEIVQTRQDEGWCCAV